MNQIEYNQMEGNNSIYPNRFRRILIYLYIIISFYEAYLNVIVGSYNRYLIFFIIIVYFFSYKKITIQFFHWWIFAWLIFKIVSIFWGNSSIYSSGNVSAYLVTHFGMVGLFMVMTMVRFDKRFVMSIINVMMFSSFSLAVLSLLFLKPYMGVESRMVLTINGIQNDPNNLAAFMLVGFCIALYYIVYEKKRNVGLYIIVIFNSIGIALTGSRGGLLSACVVIVVLLVLSVGSASNLINICKKVIIFAAVVLIIFMAVRYFIPEVIYKRLFEFTTYTSGSGRDVLWSTAIDLFKEKPFWGWGWGGTPPTQHNTYLNMLTEIGIFGTMLFLVSIGWICLRSIYSKMPLAIVIIIAGLAPSFFIEAINKRFLWNAIILAAMLILSVTDASEKTKH